MYKTYDEVLEFLNKKKFQKRIDQLAKKYQDKKVVIYGAGIIFDVIVENFNISSLNIIGISDKKFDKNEIYKGFNAITPIKIPKLNPDIVLISMYESFIIEEFFEDKIFPDFGKFKYEPLIKVSLFEYLLYLLR